MPNYFIERTPSGKLRLRAIAVHVERWALFPPGEASTTYV
jgi:hypothetical protein